MAKMLDEKHNAVDVRFRPRPTGLTGWFTLCVDTFHQAQACFQSIALIVDQPVSQRYTIINQRLPRPSLLPWREKARMRGLIKSTLYLSGFPHPNPLPV